MAKSPKLPLEGIRILEITTAWVGPGSAGMLASMGAEVIKLENPAMPDFWRRVPPFAEGKQGVNRSGAFALLNRGKKDCLLDLKTIEGVDTAKRLAKISDMVITNFSPRVMNSLGLDYDVLREVKPDIIMVYATGYGLNGPDKTRVAFGPVLEAYSGLSCMIGYPDSPAYLCGTSITDHVGAVTSAFAAMAALHHRDTTGEGQLVDLSETESALACMADAVMEYTMTGRNPRPHGNSDEIMAPHNCYRCRGDDNWIAIAAGSDEEWKNLCQAMGRAELVEDERFQDGFLRWKNQGSLDKIIAEWARDQDHIEAMKKLQEAGVAAGPVYSGEELYRDPQLRAREYFVEHEHPEVGRRELPGVLFKLSKTPGRIGGSDPLLGEHTDWVLKELLASD